MQVDAAAADDDGGGGQYYFFSAPASPVHYILRSPPSSTAAAAASSAYFAADADCCAAAAVPGDFEFAAHGAGPGGGPMIPAEELFVAGRIRVGCLSPIRQDAPPEGRRRHEDVDGWEVCVGRGGGDEEQERERDGRSPRAARRGRARSASPTRSPRGTVAEPSDPSSSTSSSSSSSSSAAKNIRRRISLRDLLSRTGGDCAGAADQASSGAEPTGRLLGFWPASITWPSSRSSKAKPPVPCPAPRPGRRSASSSDTTDRAAAAPAAKRAPGGGSGRRTTSLPYRQGLVLGCLGFGARGYGLAKSMHPLPSR